MDLKILKDLVETGLSITSIAENLKTSKGSIQYWLNKHNLKTLNKTPSKYIPYEERTEGYCNKCSITKPVSEFYVHSPKNGVRRPSFYCKDCSKAYFNEPRQERKNIAIEYKGGSCNICGYAKCAKALDFHHVDPSKKDFTLSTILGKFISVPLDSLFKELDKCVLLCANCHREVHAGITSIPKI